MRHEPDPTLRGATPSCVVLIATHRREELLEHRSLPSVARQTHAPTRVVIVDDGGTIDFDAQERFERLLAPLALDLLRPVRARGAAAAWNSGLRHLASTAFDGFVAMLDDDDSWDPDHVDLCLQTARANRANVVISGLRLWLGDRIVPRPLVSELTPAMFLTGNPGWQGSNTFVALDLLLGAGGFRDGLPSLNDRDLALRLLRHRDARTAFTGKWTATWYADTPGALSQPRSPQKARGLAAFWRLYAPAMTPEQEASFFRRGEELFQISPDQVRALSVELDPGQLPGVHGAPLE